MGRITTSQLEQSYDYLIVGSGPAGSILARQLHPHRRVLVLEAGDAHRGPLSHVPAFYPRSFGSRLDWGSQTEPQKNLADRRLRWPSGRVLGGSSSINAMIRIEPADECLLELQMTCGPDWSCDSVRASFHRLGSFWEGTLPELHPNTFTLHEQAILSGLGSRDPLSFPRSGISPYLRMQSEGRRRSVCELFPSDVLSNAFVRKLIIRNDRVVGLEAIVGNEVVKLKADQQVILCCGAIQTPRLLFQSGIGPSEALEKAGLVCTHPVDRIGVGLQDHLVYPMVFRLRQGRAFSWPFDRSQRWRYVQDRRGDKSSNLAELGAFIDPTGTSANSFQWHITPTHYLSYPGVLVHEPCVSVGITQSKPRSIGRILPAALRMSKAGGSAEVSLAIDPQYLSNTEDWDDYLRAIRWTREYFSNPIWQEIIEQEVAPGLKRDSDDSIRSHFARFATTLYHYSGSCSMGKEPGAPADSRFRLRGIEGLRICDASVFPKILGCNPQTTIMMFAMRLADWLIEELS